MTNKIKIIFPIIACIVCFLQCKKNIDNTTPAPSDTTAATIKAAFGTKIDLAQLANYANQPKPSYITKDNTVGNNISDLKATIGRVLFYDKNLSLDNTISCASCHKQAFAFGDTDAASNGVSGGKTGRHSMRLINTRFAVESKFFWDERAATLEAQTTKPMQDHAEMGFSGLNGRPNFDALVAKLQAIGYYQVLFQTAYNNTAITEARLQECLAQFIRSIQSFDAKYDVGRAQVNNNNQNFPNFTAQENTGKNLFTTPPIFDATGNRTGGGLGCDGCHKAPEFDIDDRSGNNGIIGVLNGTGIDITNTRSPSLRDLVGTNGEPNTPMMHTAALTSLQAVLGHYGSINLAPGNNRLDNKLRPNGFGQKLNLTAAEVNAVSAFLKTLTGTNVYTDAKWSNPF